MSEAEAEDETEVEDETEAEDETEGLMQRTTLK